MPAWYILYTFVRLYLKVLNYETLLYWTFFFFFCCFFLLILTTGCIAQLQLQRQYRHTSIYCTSQRMHLLQTVKQASQASPLVPFFQQHLFTCVSVYHFGNYWSISDFFLINCICYSDPWSVLFDVTNTTCWSLRIWLVCYNKVFLN